MGRGGRIVARVVVDRKGDDLNIGCLALIFAYLHITQPNPSEIKEGDEVRYTSSSGADGKGADGESNDQATAAGEPKQERAIVVKVHPDVEEPHYTIRILDNEGREKNTDASHISKVWMTHVDLFKAALLAISGDTWNLEFYSEYQRLRAGLNTWICMPR